MVSRLLQRLRARARGESIRVGPRPCRTRSLGLTLAEIIVAIGFMAVFTTGLLAIATKGFEASRQDVDIASAYQHGESLAEKYVLKSKDPAGWSTVASVAKPTFPEETDASGTTTVDDKRFVYTVDVKSISADAKIVTIVIYRSDEKKAEQKTPEAAIDATAPHGGELLRFVNILQQEVNG